MTSPHGKFAAMLCTALLALPLRGAEPLYEPIPDIHAAARAALKSGALKNGQTSFPAVIKGKSCPGTWEFWGIGKGGTPADFKLIPMKFRAQGVNKGQFLTPRGGCFTDLNFGRLRNLGEVTGIAFSFRNPSKEALEIELDGGLRLYSFDPAKPFDLFVFTVDSDGKRKIVSSSADKEPFFVIDGARHYFRLSVDVRLEKGARVFVALNDPDLTKAPSGKIKVVFCLNEGHRKWAFMPRFILRSPVRN